MELLEVNQTIGEDSSYQLINHMNIIINFGHQSGLREFQFNAFNLWKVEYYTNELMNEYNNTVTLPSMKRELITQIMNNAPSNVVFYQLTINYNFYRNSHKKIKVLILKTFHKGKSNNKLDIDMVL